MTRKEYMLQHNQSESQRKAVSKANSSRVWTDAMRNNLSEAMKASHKKRKENKTVLLNG